MTILDRIKEKFEKHKHAMSDGMGEVAVFDSKTGAAIYRSKNDPQLMLARIESDKKREADLVINAGVLVANLSETQLEKIVSGLGREDQDQNPFLPLIDEKEKNESDQKPVIGNPFLPLIEE